MFKKLICVLAVLVLCCASFYACSSTTAPADDPDYDFDDSISASDFSDSDSYDEADDDDYTPSYTVHFTNKYGTPTTKCAHSGCTNYIASSGDTNCCTIHSNTCGQCGKYIDEDAMFCMDCLQSALDEVKGYH